MILPEVNLTDSAIMGALGISDTRHSYICSNAHGRINSFSWHKPMIYAKNSELSGNEWAGEVGALQQGIFCGLKMGTNGGRLGDLHDGTFEYFPPTGGDNDPFRVGDFRGYDTAAVPTPTAEVNTRITYGGDHGLTVSFSHNPNNTTGVNLEKWFELSVQTWPPVALGDSYLCALISTADRRQSCYIAMRNYDTGTITPVKYNGKYVQHWYIDLGVNSGVPAMLNKATGTAMVVSIFLAPSLTPAGQNQPASLSQWTEMGYMDTANTPQGCIGVFNALGVQCSIYNAPQEAEKPENKAIRLTSVTDSSYGLTLNWERKDSSLTSVLVNVIASAQGFGGYNRVWTFALSANSGSWSVSWNDIHLTGMPAGQQVSVTTQLYRGSQMPDNLIISQDWSITTTYNT